LNRWIDAPQRDFSALQRSIWLHRAGLAAYCERVRKSGFRPKIARY
jgi:hypothetical protein